MIVIENHDFSVYNGKSEDEINNLIAKNVVNADDREAIAGLLLDMGLVRRNVFLNISKMLVGVQPMTKPLSSQFQIKFRIKSDD